MSANLKAVSAAIDAVHKAFGAPGDYGYGTPKGDALMALYRSQIAISTASEPVAWASSSEMRRNQLLSAAQYKNALPKNVVDFDIPLYAHPSR
jgi:hypothetical protein